MEVTLFIVVEVVPTTTIIRSPEVVLLPQTAVVEAANVEPPVAFCTIKAALVAMP